MEGHVVSRLDGAAWRIELNRPDIGNLVTMDMVGALEQALHETPADARLVVVSGRGADFCRGRDYQGAPEEGRDGRPPAALDIRSRMTGPVGRLYARLRDVPVPTLAVVQGGAFGLGCALAGACDIVLASTRARFRLPEMLKGLPPTLALCALMDRVNATGLAYLVYSAREIDAEAACRFGLASHVVAPDALQAEAAALVSAISGYPAASVRAVREYLRLAPGMEPRGRAELAAAIFATVVSSR